MDNDLLSFVASNFYRIQSGYDSIQNECVFQGKHFFPNMELMEEVTSLPTQNHYQLQPHHQEPEFDNLVLEEFTIDPVFQATHPEFVLYNNNKPSSTSSVLTSLELLSSHESRFKKLVGEIVSKPIITSTESCHGRKNLSAEEIIRLAGERYVKLCTNWDDIWMPTMHQYGYLGDLSEEENRDVELVQLLLTAAERVDSEQFERASRLLSHCKLNSSACVTPVQKVIFYFAQALGERISKETGTITENGFGENQEHEMVQKIDYNVSTMCHRKIPFNQVMQLTGVQAIVENLASEKKIHVIDLSIGCGVQWTALMQSLANRHERPLQLLKITAIGFRGKNRLEGTGKCLECFAESLNLRFSYKAIYVTDMMELETRQYELDIEEDEAVAVYAPYVLRTMVSKPKCLERLMGILGKMKPSIIIVLEVEANHNSPSFVNRFVEALFYFSAFVDCVETCMGMEEKECKMALEAIIYEGIRNIVAMEGTERTVRNVKIDVWRRFFARYRAVETEFSETSLFLGNLVVKEFAHGKFCTFDRNGKSLIFGWKGTPINSLSAWKFI